jgi:hypothetical protein
MSIFLLVLSRKADCLARLLCSVIELEPGP